MKKVRKYSARIKSWVKNKTANDLASRPSTPAPLEPVAAVISMLGMAASHPAPISATSATPLGSGIVACLKAEGWTSLKGLLNHFGRGVDIIGLGDVKTVVEGFANCIGIYEEAAHGRKEYAELQDRLECIFEDLKLYASESTLFSKSVESICRSIQKELEYVKAQHDRPVIRRIQEAETDADDVLKCYQRIQVHLERLSRNANLSAWITMDQIATENRLQRLGASSWACYNSEKALELERRSCTDGTRTNLLAQMNQWAAAPDTGNIFWMSGMAGTGKTTIAYSLCEQLDDKTNRMLCASFFCSRSLPECRDVGRIIPSIAFQLAQCSQPFRYALSQATEKEPLAHTRLPQLQFELLIVQPFSDPKVREAFPANMVVVIDALDECDDVKSTKHILDVLLTKANDLPIKFVLSSRPEPAIRDQMEQNAAWVDARVVLHELDTGEVQNDIRTYLKAELAPIQPTDSEIEQLVTRAGVLFIYAATVVRYVGADNFKRNPRARLKRVLDLSTQPGKAQTKEIDRLYETILDSAVGDIDLEETEREDMKLILDTVICAREPLTVDAINKLLNLNDVERVHAAIRPLWSVLHVTEVTMTVTTLHASFPDFLFDSTRSGAWHCDAKAHHQLLAQRCFECIRDTKPQFNICRLESSYLRDDEVPDLSERVKKFISTELKYSCQYWISHLEATEANAVADLAPMVSQFLTKYLLLWMEVRSLTKTFPATLGDLTAAKQWATKYDRTRDMVDFLTDAWRFASTFVSNPVSQSTPHLYISILPLLSSHSPIRNHYFDRFEGLVGIEGTGLDRRKEGQLAQWKFDFDVQCMACSPDGTRVAVGGRKGGYPTSYGRLYLLDAFNGSLLLDLPQEGGATTYSIAFSPDSTHLASGNSDGYISIWDVANGQPILSPFKAHQGIVLSLLYSHDGSSIISTSVSDQAIRVWDPVTGKPAPTPTIGYPHKVTCIAISSDDKLLVSGSLDGTVRLWDFQSGQSILDSMKEQKDRISEVAFAPDSSYIVSGSVDGTIVVWDTKTGQIIHSPIKDPGECVLSVSISPDGASIASVSRINEVLIWDVASGKHISQLGPFTSEIDYGSFKWATYSPDGTRILFIQNRMLRLLDARVVVPASDPPPGHTKCITSVDISPNGQYLASASFDCNVCVWDLATGELLLGPLHGHTQKVNLVRFSTDGSRIVSAARETTIRQWDTHSGASRGAPIQVASDDEYKWVVSAIYSPDDTQIVSLNDSGELWVWNSNTGQSIMGPVAAPHEHLGIQAHFTSDGASVIACYENGWVGMWDVKTGQLVSSHQPEGYNPWDVSGIEPLPNGIHYAQSFKDGRINVRNLRTGEQVLEFSKGHVGYVMAVRSSPDGSRVVSGASDYAVYVWDVESGRPVLGPLKGHINWVTSVAYSRDGKYVVSSSDEMVIRVWDVETNKVVSENPNTVHADWVLNEDGWVVSGDSRRLFWVPTDLYKSLMAPRNTMLLSRDGYLKLNFEKARIGDKWTDCWRNV